MSESFFVRFCNYAPELAYAILLAEDHEFLAELNSTEATSSAFTVCDAFSEFWAAWHGGQDSRLYALGSCFSGTFDYSHRDTELEDNTPVRDFYAALCMAFNVDDKIGNTVFAGSRRRLQNSPILYWGDAIKRFPVVQVASLVTYNGEDFPAYRLVAISAEHDFPNGPYQDTVGFAVGSNQTIEELEWSRYAANPTKWEAGETENTV